MGLALIQAMKLMLLLLVFGEVMTMKIRYYPHRTDVDLSYSFDGDAVTVILGGQSKRFDFGDAPEGEIEVTCGFEPCPVLNARRSNGVLHLTLIRAVPARPQPSNYETSKEFDDALAIWKQLWTDEKQ